MLHARAAAEAVAAEAGINMANIMHFILYKNFNDFMSFGPIQAFWEDTLLYNPRLMDALVSMWGHGGVLDESNDAVFILTGFNSSLTNFDCGNNITLSYYEILTSNNKVWRIDLESKEIKQITPSGILPDPRGAATVVFDSYDGASIVFGGADISSDGIISGFKGDLWALSPGAGLNADNKCLPSIEHGIDIWKDDYDLTGECQLLENNYMYLQLKDNIPKEDQIYWGRVILYIDESWAGEDEGSITVSLWDDDTEYIENFERTAPNCITAHMWYTSPIRFIKFQYTNLNTDYAGINRIYEIILDLAQGPNLYNDQINLIETAHNYPVDNTIVDTSDLISQPLLPPNLYRLTHWRCNLNTPYNSDCTITTSGSLPLFPGRFFNMESDVTPGLFMKAESMRVWIDNPEYVSVDFEIWAFGDDLTQPGTNYMAAWNGNCFEIMFGIPAKRIEKVHTTIINSGITTRWVGLVQLVNYSDPVDFGLDGTETSFTLPQRYAKPEAIKIYNNNPVDNTVADARVLPKFSNNYELDSSIKVTSDPNLSIWEADGWKTIDNGIRIPEDYPWSLGTFSKDSYYNINLTTVDEQGRLALTSVWNNIAISGTWTSPILVCENPSITIPYMYTSDTGWKKGYVNRDDPAESNTSVTEILRARATDSEPIEIFAVTVTDTSAPYFNGKHKRVVFDSLGNNLFFDQCGEGGCSNRPLIDAIPNTTIRYQFPIQIHYHNRIVAMPRNGLFTSEEQTPDKWDYYGAYWAAYPSDTTSISKITTSGFKDWVPSPGSPWEYQWFNVVLPLGVAGIFCKPIPRLHAYGAYWDFPCVMANHTPNQSDGSLSCWWWSAYWYNPRPFTTVAIENIIDKINADSIRGAACLSLSGGEFVGWLYMGVKDEMGQIWATHMFQWYYDNDWRSLPFFYFSTDLFINDMHTATQGSIDGIERFWAITEDQVVLFAYDGPYLTNYPDPSWQGTLEIVCTVTGSSLDNTPFKYLHYGSVDRKSNLWVVDSKAHRILKLDFAKAMAGEDPVVYDRYVPGAVGIYAMPDQGGAYVYCTYRQDYGFTDVVMRYNRFDDADREEFICKVPGLSVPVHDGIYFAGILPYFDETVPTFVPVSYDPVWGLNAAEFDWISVPNGSPTLPSGMYKQLEITIQKDPNNLSSPVVDKIRLPIPTIVNSIKWHDSKDVYIDIKPNTNLYVLGSDEFSIDLLVWWPQERIGV